MRTALVALSQEGARIIEKIASGFDDADLFVHENINDPVAGTPFRSIVALTVSLFQNYRNIIYVAPCGVVVRAMASCLENKYKDPAVVVADAGGRWVVSLLSGHEGGANELAVRVGNLIGAEPVVTTTTEALKFIIIGIGCRRGVSAETVVAAVKEALERAGVGLEEVRLLASADIKSNEAGLREAATSLGVPIRFIPSGQIRDAKKAFTQSDLAQKKVGLPAVAEPAALLAGKSTKLILERITWKGVTVAMARENSL